MEIFVCRPGAEKVEENYTPADLPDLLKDQSLVIWVDMERPTEEDDRVLADVFHFHPLTIEDSRSDRHHPKIEEFPDYIYFIIHGVTVNTTPEKFTTIELDGYLGRNFIVTYHHDMFRSINNMKQRVRSSPLACQRGAAFLLHQIMDQVVDFYVPVLEAFDERITKIEDDIFMTSRPAESILEQILDLKRSVLRLRRISSKQLDILYRISHGQFGLIDASMLPFYRDVYDHLVRVVDLSETYRDLIAGTLDAYMTVASNRLNEVMKVLTIFSAIMLPLTFIAGVYGMNFENMPELKSTYGYFFTLAVMVIVACGMLIFFWRRGWIGQTKEKSKG
jgi:magnesium transporter